MIRSSYLVTSLLLASLSSGSACSPADEPETTKEEVVELEIDEFHFDLDGDRLLSSLEDDEIEGACEALEATISQAEEQVACQIQAVASTSKEGACGDKREECLSDSAQALDDSELLATPEPIDCGTFNAALTADCDLPVSLLELCVNSMAQSLAPSFEAISCEEAGEIESIDAANDVARMNQGSEYILDCFDLLECEALVSALISGG